MHPESRCFSRNSGHSQKQKTPVGTRLTTHAALLHLGVCVCVCVGGGGGQVI